MQDMWETSRDIMKKIKSGNHDGAPLSKLVYTLNTLLNHANKLEDNFEDLTPDQQEETEQPNRIRYVYEDEAGDAPPPWPAGEPQIPVPPQSVGGVRAALERMGIRANQDPESPPPGAQTLLMGLPNLENSESKPAQPGKRRQKPKRRRHKTKRRAR